MTREPAIKVLDKRVLRRLQDIQPQQTLEQVRPGLSGIEHDFKFRWVTAHSNFGRYIGIQDIGQGVVHNKLMFCVFCTLNKKTGVGSQL